MTEKQKNGTLRGVEYNYINNINKRNKRNNKLSSVSSTSSQSKSKNTETHTEDFRVICLSEKRDSVSASPESFNDTVKTAGFWLWDNGPECKHRWLLSVRFNFVDGSNGDFLVNLTKDMRNFKKYIPEESYDTNMEFVNSIRQSLNVKPYLGKFRDNDPNNDIPGMGPIEPFTSAVVWWDEDNVGDKWWRCAIMFYDMLITFDFENANITPRQKAQGCKGYHKYTNQTHLKRKLTWAEKQGKNFTPKGEL